jgi:hypothetical protein
MGFGSSLSCDMYQLGRMFKFLTKKGLLFLVDFSPASLDSVADTSLLPVDSLLKTLAECPSYQIDEHQYEIYRLLSLTFSILFSALTEYQS